MAKIKIISDRVNTFFTNNKMTVGESIPVTGTWSKGDIVISTIQANGECGWICVEAGTPGRWEIFGAGNNYTHPDTHPATMITEDATHRFVTDEEKTKWNCIGDKNQLQTNNKDDLVSAINELHSTLNGQVTRLKDMVNNLDGII